MRYFLIIAVSLLVIGCGNDVGRYEAIKLRGSSGYLLDTKTGSIWEKSDYVNNSKNKVWVKYIEPIDPKE